MTNQPPSRETVEAVMRACAASEGTFEHGDECRHCRIMNMMARIAREFVERKDFGPDAILRLSAEQGGAILAILQEHQ